LTNYPLEEQFAEAEAIHLTEPIDPPETRSDRHGLNQAEVCSMIAEGKRKAARGPVCKENGYTFEQWCDELTVGRHLSSDKLLEMYEQDWEAWVADDRIRDYAT